MKLPDVFLAVEPTYLVRDNDGAAPHDHFAMVTEVRSAGRGEIHYNRRRTRLESAAGAPRRRSAFDLGTRGAQSRSGVA